MKIYETNRHFVSKKCNAVFTYNIVNILTHKSVFFNWQRIVIVYMVWMMTSFMTVTNIIQNILPV